LLLLLLLLRQSAAVQITWSCMSDSRGHTTTVTPGRSTAGSCGQQQEQSHNKRHQQQNQARFLQAAVC
jgi:hypothetical protein